ncbi:MAG: hypothetical protein KF795_30735 [Labilithrix sp.]|nr:hypothetical protein [Labilithrix sp.]
MKAAALAVSAAFACATLLAATSARAACMGRPTAGGYGSYVYPAGEAESFATAKVRVHWAKSGTHAATLTSTRDDGVPDSVAYAADVAEGALTKFAEMGYRPVPADTTCDPDGDGKLDIYLVRFSGGDGACIAECNGGTCSSFALIDSTYRGRGYASPQEGFRTVVTHELFHAIQNVYKTNDDPFWAEGTAQWAMKTLHPELKDFERNLPKFFDEPTRSLDAPPTGVTAGYLYGAAVWPLFLATSHGPETIREIFELEAEGKPALEATDAVLAKKGSSLAAAYPMFGAWNAATAGLAGTGGYPDGASYPGIKAGALEDGTSNITSGLAYFVYKGTLDAPRRIALETDAERNGGVVVPLEGGKARIDRAERLPANAEGEVLVVVAGTTTKKTDAPFTIRFEAPDATAPGSSSGAPGGGAAADDGCRAAPGRSPSGGDLALASVAVAVVLRRASSRRKRD